MVNNIKDIKKERIELNNYLQEQINNNKNYKEKILQIYKIILKSQMYYCTYKENNILNNYEEIIEKINNIEDMDDFKFIDFIYTNLIFPLNNDHVNISFEEEKYNIVLKIYNKILKNSKEDVYKKFIKENNLSKILFEISIINNKEDIEKYLNQKFYFIKKERKLANDENFKYNFSNENLYLKLKSFSRKYLDNDKRKLVNLKKELENTNIENVIIDLRDNGGGTDEYFEFFSIFSNEDIFYEIKYRNLFSNNNESAIINAIPKGTNKKYNMFLLVNNKVFSTAEKFTKIYKTSGLAKVIGEPTLGDGNGLTPLKIDLNLSLKTNFQFTIEAPINEKGEIDYTEFNTIPDIECNSERALDVVYDMINNHKNNKGIKI